MSGKLKEIKLRIKAVKDTQQITKAMKMVSAAKLRRAQDAITRVRPYSEKLNEVLGNIVAGLEGDVSLSLAQEREVEKVLVVLLTSDRGLCGSFNTNLIKKAKVLVEDTYKEIADAGNLTLMTIGKKGNEFYTSKYPNLNVIGDHVELFSNLEFTNTAAISESIMSAFEAGEYDRVEVVYSKFKNAAVQDFSTETFLPIQVATSSEELESSANNDFIFEPERAELLEELVPRILKTYFHRMVLDNNASEHGARMTSMDNASENCNELLGDLTILYNRARQAAITTELTEIVSGAAALEAS